MVVQARVHHQQPQEAEQGAGQQFRFGKIRRLPLFRPAQPLHGVRGDQQRGSGSGDRGPSDVDKGGGGDKNGEVAEMADERGRGAIPAGRHGESGHVRRRKGILQLYCFLKSMIPLNFTLIFTTPSLSEILIF